MWFEQKIRCIVSSLMDQASHNRVPDARFRLPFFTALSVLILMLVVSPIIPAAEPQDTFDHEHFLFTEVLSEHVTNGLVNYRALKADQARLNEYLQEFAEIDPETYKKWTRQQKLALWINAYNAYTIKAILDHYPIESSWLADPLGHYPDNSIRQIQGVWDDYTWPVMGKKYTFNHMEHEILRKKIVEPRIHFVLVCASKGCPLLESRAYEADGLGERLDQAAVNYIYRDQKVRIDKTNKVLALPQIFKWFEEDFQVAPDHTGLFQQHPKQIRGVLSWVYRYASKDDRKFLADESFEVTYLYYDWALNEQ